MSRKLKLDAEALSVESFPTHAVDGGELGTVRGQALPCTCARTCACPSARYQCADEPFTNYSCDYTFNETSCEVVADTVRTCASWEFACDVAP